MSDATTPYVVGRGEHLLTIATQFGLQPDDIWNHPKNADLAKIRDADVLAPGDVLQIPKPPTPTLKLTHGTSNRYRAKLPTVKVELAFSGPDGPFANDPYEVHGLADEPLKGTTDAQGHIDFEAKLNRRKARIVFPKRHVEHTVDIGGLDPASTPSGAAARLGHLGLRASSDPEHIKAFQASHGLPTSGKPDAATAALLTKLCGR